MYRVLVPVARDEDRALEQAELVAALPDAANSVEAFVLFVFQGEDEEDLPDELKRFKSADRVASVRRVRDFLGDRDIEVEILEDSGDTAEDILSEAAAFDVDAIVLNPRRRSPVGKAVFGSVTQSVILNADRPVMVVGGDAH